MRFKTQIFLIAVLITVFLWSCRQKKEKKVIIDQTITPTTSYNNMFMDSSDIKKFIAKDTTFNEFTDLFINFYRHRNFEFAWFDTSGIVEQARNFVSLLNNDGDSLESGEKTGSMKRLNDIIDNYSKGITPEMSHQDIINDELTLTGEFFKKAKELFKGKGNIDAEQLGWFIPRKKIDFSALLDSTLSGKAMTDGSQLLNPQFKELRSYLQKYIALKKSNTWDSIGLDANKLKLNDSSAEVTQIKKRLYLLGDLEEENEDATFDKPMLEAVKSFQTRYGLSDDGVIGPNFMRALNTPIDTLIKVITVNLERVRWIPSELPNIYIWVNIPEYKLRVFDNGEEQFKMNVIVGSAAHGTTIFSGNIKYIVFAPYWNVPSSIVKKEILPGIKNNPNYLAAHNMEITGRDQGIPVVRQLPGPNNSLGRVKFLFPNSYNIYLHDTPNHDLFDSRDRGLSHGCVRLSDPEKMANWLLRDDTIKYSSAVIDSLMNKNVKEKWVTLNKTVPVFLVYFTSWVDEQGKLNFRKDIYGHDAKIADKLFTN